jgi:hypothetical protein
MAGLSKVKEKRRMELALVVPDWWTWIAAGAAGVLALAALARGLDALFELDAG